MKLLSIITTGIIATQGVQARTPESVWLAQIDGNNPIMMNIISSTTNRACKLINGVPVYIVPTRQKLPGTDSFIELTPDKVSMIKNAPNCPNARGIISTKKGLDPADL